MRFLQTSLRYKLITLLLISIVVPIVTSIVVTYIYTKESIKDRTIQENTLLFSEGRTNIANFLESVNNASLIIYSNTKLDSILSKGVTDYQDESYIFTALQLVSRAAKDIYQVFLYLTEDQRSYLMYQHVFTRGLSTIRPFTDKFIAPYSALTEPTHPSHSYGIQQLTPPKPDLVFTIHRPLYRVPTIERIGLLSIDVKLDALRKLSAQLYEKDKEDFYIIDKSGAVVYASDESLVGHTPDASWIGQISSTTDSIGSLEWNESDFKGIIIYSKITYPSLEWTVVKRIPDKYLYAYTRKLTMINTVVAVLFLTMALAAILIVSIRFTNPIKKLIRSMNRIQAGSLDEPIEVDRTDEIGILARRFRTMMHTINDLILREYKLDLANKTNQLKMLQAQINPHFINNALQSIGTSALDNNAPEVYSLISSLGQMMHYSMNTKETIVPLSKEIDYVNYYVLLQQERFEDKLFVEFNIDEQTGAIPIPKMIIQPIVENFFKHGFHAAKGSSILRVSTYILDGMLQIVVEDNGTGIPEERLSTLRYDLSNPQHNPSEGGERIGLINVLLRLRLYYGEQARMDLADSEPHGLKVTLTIPLTQQEEDYDEGTYR